MEWLCVRSSSVLYLWFLLRIASNVPATLAGCHPATIHEIVIVFMTDNKCIAYLFKLLIEKEIY